MIIALLLACTNPPIDEIVDTDLPDEDDLVGGCSDGVDNDADDRTDCDDEACAGLPMCRVDTDDTEIQPCDEVTIDKKGPDEPIVGDSWTVLLECDGANITSGLVIRLEPADFASVAQNVITFARGGTGTLKVQAGSERAEMQILVLD